MRRSSISIARFAPAALASLALVPAVWGQAAAPQATSSSAPSSVPASVRNAHSDLRFDVVSVKPSDPKGGRGRSNVPLTDGERYTSANDGYFSAAGQALERYIAFAYDLDPNPDPQLNGLPPWTFSTRYDIEARASHPVTKDEMRTMMRNLLADRFMLTTHYELRNMPVYTLTMLKPGKFGPQMRPHQDEPGHSCDPAPAAPASPDPGAPPTGAPAPAPTSAPAPAAAPAAGRGGGRAQRATPDGFPEACGEMVGLTPSHPGRELLSGRNTTMEILVNHLNGGIDRPVVDLTGLTGRFDWWFEYSPDSASDGPSGYNFQMSHPDDDGPHLWAALPQQTGLKLTPTKMEIQFLIFDHVERPTAN